MSGRSTRCSRRSSWQVSTTRPSCGRGRCGSGSTSRRSAAPPASAAPAASPTPTPTRRPGRIATCWWWAAARQASRQRWRPAAPAPGSFCARTIGGWAAGCCPTRPRSTAAAGSTGPTQRWRSSPRSTRSPSCHAPPCSASMTAAPTGRCSASATTCRCRPSTSRGSGSGASSPGAAWSAPARSSGRSCFPATTGRASCWLRRCAPISAASPCCPPGGRSSSPAMTTAGGPWRRSALPAARWRPWSIRAAACRRVSKPGHGACR